MTTRRDAFDQAIKAAERERAEKALARARRAFKKDPEGAALDLAKALTGVYDAAQGSERASRSENIIYPEHLIDDPELRKLRD
jgi:hypothetical protein